MKTAPVLDLSYLEPTKKTVDCPVCGSAACDMVSEGLSRGGIHLAYVICKNCSHIYMKHRPSAEGYTQFYVSGDYRKLTGDHTNTQALREDEAAFKKRYAHGERLYEDYLKGKLGPGDIAFDFGCGDGAWLYGLKKASGCEVDGNEPSAEDVAFIKEKLGVDIFHGLVEDCADAILQKYEGRVKVAVISGSLQHMLEPMKCLELAYRILQKDGYLYVCNKNIFVHYLPTTSPYPRPFSELRTVDHPHYFHEDAYRYMLEKAGFEIVALSNDSRVRVAHMEVLARKRDPKSEPIPKGDPRRVVARIREMDAQVAIYRSFPMRLLRFVKRRLTALFLSKGGK